MIRCIQCERPIEQELAPAVLVFRGPLCDSCDAENKRERWRAPDIDVRMAEVPNSEEY